MREPGFECLRLLSYRPKTYSCCNEVSAASAFIACISDSCAASTACRMGIEGNLLANRSQDPIK